MVSSMNFIWRAVEIFKNEKFVNYVLAGEDGRWTESGQWEDLLRLLEFFKWEKSWMPELRDRGERPDSRDISGVELILWERAFETKGRGELQCITQGKEFRARCRLPGVGCVQVEALWPELYLNSTYLVIVNDNRNYSRWPLTSAP